jgi:N-acetylmuramoyl-L-alanine amidase
MQVAWHPSPNFTARRGQARPSLVVLHATCMADHAAALVRLCDPASEVSAHYLIAPTGQVCALVPEEMRAWHAGAGGWRGVGDMNSASIGIELTNTGTQPFAAPQMLALCRLLDAIRGRWSMPPEAVIGHSDMAPGRKSDPGPRFDWRALALAGHGLWLDPDPADPECADPAMPTLARSLTQIGYPEAAPEARLAAFRLHYRPQAAQSAQPLPEQPADRALAARLAQRLAAVAPQD